MHTFFYVFGHIYVVMGAYYLYKRHTRYPKSVSRKYTLSTIAQGIFLLGGLQLLWKPTATHTAFYIVFVTLLVILYADGRIRKRLRQQIEAQGVPLASDEKGA